MSKCFSVIGTQVYDGLLCHPGTNMVNVGFSGVALDCDHYFSTACPIQIKEKGNGLYRVINDLYYAGGLYLRKAYRNDENAIVLIDASDLSNGVEFRQTPGVCVIAHYLSHYLVEMEPSTELLLYKGWWSRVFGTARRANSYKDGRVLVKAIG